LLLFSHLVRIFYSCYHLSNIPLLLTFIIVKGVRYCQVTFFPTNLPSCFFWQGSCWFCSFCLEAVSFFVWVGFFVSWGFVLCDVGDQIQGLAHAK
jgi:hypothetical protein